MCIIVTKYVETKELQLYSIYKEVEGITIFSERLRALRTSRSISQERLARQLNYGYTAIANYESGRNEPSISDLSKIADFFDVSVDYLIGRTDNMMSHKSLALYERLKDTTLFDLMRAAEYAKSHKNSEG